MGFLELSKRLNGLIEYKLIDIMQNVLKKHYKEIVELNKKQLAKGEKSDGSYMKEYSRSTINVRQAESNPVKGTLIALYDTGEFWKGFWALAYENKLELLSSDTKTNMLITTYGENIFGLTKSSFEQLADIIVPDLKTEILTFLNQR